MDITADAENGDVAVNQEDEISPHVRALKAIEARALERGMNDGDKKSADTAPEPTPPGQPSVQSQLDRLEILIAKAVKGDAAAIAEVEEFFADGENRAWREAGNLADVAEKVLATVLFQGSRGRPRSVARYGRELREQLIDKDVSPLEKLAIERVVLAWNFACAVDVLVASSREGVASAAFVRAPEGAGAIPGGASEPPAGAKSAAGPRAGRCEYLVPQQHVSNQSRSGLPFNASGGRLPTGRRWRRDLSNGHAVELPTEIRSTGKPGSRSAEGRAGGGLAARSCVLPRPAVKTIQVRLRLLAPQFHRWPPYRLQPPAA